MLHVYKGVLHGDRIEWANGTPAPVLKGQPIKVEVTLLNPPETPEEELERRKRMVTALESLAALPREERGLLPADPVAWQREIRKDRPLPGRED